jgi:hypothetical protein
VGRAGGEGFDPLELLAGSRGLAAGDGLGQPFLGVNRSGERVIAPLRARRRRQRSGTPERRLVSVGKGVHRLAVQPGVEVHVGRAEGKRHEAVEAAVAGQGDRLPALDDLPDLHETARQVGGGGHQTAAVVDEDLEPAAIELTGDPDDLAGGRRDDAGADRDREVGPVVAVVGESLASEVLHLRLPDRPPQLDRRLTMIEEVGDDRPSLDVEATPPVDDGETGAELRQTRESEPARRNVLLPAKGDQRLPVALPPRVESERLSEESDLRGSRIHRRCLRWSSESPHEDPRVVGEPRPRKDTTRDVEHLAVHHHPTVIHVAGADGEE